MAANRTDSIIINGESHEIIYNHDSNAITVTREGSEFGLEAVEGQYILETPQRRDLVINDLLFKAERSGGVTSADLVKHGFRQV